MLVVTPAKHAHGYAKHLSSLVLFTPKLISNFSPLLRCLPLITCGELRTWLLDGSSPTDGFTLTRSFESLQWLPVV